MMTKGMILAGVLLAFGLAAAGLAAEQGPTNAPLASDAQGRNFGPGAGAMEQMMLGRILNDAKVSAELGLTEAQLHKLRDGAFDLQEQRAKLKAELEVAAIQQARALTEDTVDEKSVMAAVERTGALRTQIAKVEMRGLLLMRSTLSKAQRDKVHQVIRRRMAQHMAEGQGRTFGRDDRMGSFRERQEQRRVQQERHGQEEGGPSNRQGRLPQEPPPQAPPPPKTAAP